MENVGNCDTIKKKCGIIFTPQFGFLAVMVWWINDAVSTTKIVVPFETKIELHSWADVQPSTSAQSLSPANGRPRYLCPYSLYHFL
jgi:hypothetical protein